MFKKSLIALLVFGMISGITFTRTEAAIGGQQVSITGSVVDNPYPVGTDYRDWNLVLAGPDGRQIVAEAKGFNPLPIVKAHYLAKIAHEDGNPVSVTGTLKQESDSTVKVYMKSIEYEGYTIYTNKGPFAPYYYGDCYPGSPLFYGGYTFYPYNWPF